MPFNIGTTIHKRYEIRAKADIGSFARSYRAYDLQADHEVIIQESAPLDNNGRQLFLDTIEQRQSIDYHLLPKIYEHFFEGDCGCLAIEYIPGNTLSDYLDGLRYGLPMPLALNWGAQLLEALQIYHSHTPPLTHGDIKPSNIVIHAGSGEAYLIDFGMFTWLGQAQGVHDSSDFAAPEQSALPLTNIALASDVYAVGAVLYQMLTGQRPPKQRAVTIEEVCNTNSCISLDLSRVIAQAMAVNQNERFTDASALLHALQPFATASSNSPQIMRILNEADDLHALLKASEQIQKRLSAELAQARAESELRATQIKEQSKAVALLQKQLSAEKHQLAEGAEQSRQELADQVRRRDELKQQLIDQSSQMEAIKQASDAERVQLLQTLAQGDRELAQQRVKNQGSKSPAWFIPAILLLALAFGGALGAMLTPRKELTVERTVLVEITAPPETALALFAATATAVSVPSHTTNPVAQAEQEYQQGQRAIEAQDWPTAARLLQKVFDSDPNYRDVRSMLSTTYYSWGVAKRDEGKVAVALEQFLAVLEVNPEHPSAAVEEQKAQIFLGAVTAEQLGASESAIEGYRLLLAMQHENYADVNDRLYRLLVAQAGAKVVTGDPQQITMAGDLYQEASELKVSDTSVAVQGLKEVDVLLATPTPLPTNTPVSANLHFTLKNYNDDPRCISVQISGIVPAGWTFVVNGISSLRGKFDEAGNARLCGLRSGQEVTFTVFDGYGLIADGGSGIVSKGGAIMIATWR